MTRPILGVVVHADAAVVAEHTLSKHYGTGHRTMLQASLGRCICRGSNAPPAWPSSPSEVSESTRAELLGSYGCCEVKRKASGLNGPHNPKRSSIAGPLRTRSPLCDSSCTARLRRGQQKKQRALGLRQDT
ncbi:hypothetical protein HBH70_183660 [Parastagonospora nodorum]|nr:hypothetical protein HBH53_211930 [Parastagonospora nodorum]KAH3966425.1 hypothetical protein HBH52_199370 [Parastagonospora nodorum]KAH3977725.1 hypothetical protein HBH51_072190 [Parastagonospora nodorum]KAH4062411.1 hypothetical protein HBH50_208560 [Parastagonospora nodorum]KAH4080722.1 hypothetical protein HBH48_207150 [Parastagonospora nodorum]